MDVKRVFNLKAELLKYCQSDVRILEQACLKFADEFKDICQFDPFEECTTIAFAFNVAYRRHWMRPRTIAVEPLHGWNPQRRQSTVAFEWLYHLETMFPPPEDGQPHICHSRDRGEVTLMIREKRYRATIPEPGSSTSFTGASTTDALSVTLNATNGMTSWTRPPRTTCRGMPSNGPIVFVKKDTWSSTNGSASGHKKNGRIPNYEPGLRTSCSKPRSTSPDAFFGGLTEAVQAHCQAVHGNHSLR